MKTARARTVNSLSMVQSAGTRTYEKSREYHIYPNSNIRREETADLHGLAKMHGRDQWTQRKDVVNRDECAEDLGKRKLAEARHNIADMTLTESCNIDHVHHARLSYARHFGSFIPSGWCTCRG